MSLGMTHYEIRSALDAEVLAYVADFDRACSEAGEMDVPTYVVEVGEDDGGEFRQTVATFEGR